MADPSQSKLRSSLENLLFTFSVFLLLATVGAFFGLQYLISQDETKLATLTAAMSKQKTADERALERQVLGYRQQLQDYPKILADHRKPSAIFKQLEDSIHPGVIFANMKFDPIGGALDTSGKSQDFVSLAKQLAILRKMEDVYQSVSLTQVSLTDDGTVDFSFSLKVKPQAIAFESE